MSILGQECAEADYCCAGDMPTTTPKPAEACEFLKIKGHKVQLCL